jgi:hypothetical protein
LTYYSIASTTDTFCSVLVRAVDWSISIFALWL